MNNFINWSELECKKVNGKEKIRCPNCDDLRSDKRDKSLLINHNEGYGKCFYCEALTFKESEYTKNEHKYAEVSQEWQNYTNLSDKLVQWVREDRGIRQETLIHFGITEEVKYQPAKQKELNNIVFNYFEGDKVVNKKYRSPGKDFTQVTGGKPILYNLNAIVGEDEAFIVEGEFDVLSLYEGGIKNVVSLPNGANDNDDYWINSKEYLKSIKRFIIATDNDEKGIVIRDKIAQRLGRYRCEFIEWKGKDANDDLLSGDLEASVNGRKPFPVGGTFNSEDLVDEVKSLYKNGLPNTIYPKHECFGDFRKIHSLMRGQVETVTGIPSHGKSNFSEWLVLNLINDWEMKASFFSPEHSPIALHETTFIEKAVGKPFWGKEDRLTEADIDRYTEWAKQKIYFTSSEGKFPTWDWLLEKFKEQMYTYGIDIFVIDAFNKLAFAKGKSGKEAIDEVLTKLTLFAQMNNVIIILVAHPTKMRKTDQGTYETPTLYDVSGSADFRNQTHGGLVVHRYFEEQFTMITSLKVKFKFQGEIGGQVPYNYHIPSGRYYLAGTLPPTFDMTRGNEPEVPEELIFNDAPNALSPNIDFDNGSDPPF
jgi:twinkle protein